MGRFIDLTGKRFGMLAVIARAPNAGGRAVWKCRCDCGNTVTARTGDLISGRKKSCGCLKLKHGDAGTGKRTRLYRIWLGMKTRCLDERDHTYPLYGGRGIELCKEWAEDYRNFKCWATANGYADNLSIDRINPNGPYAPENCRWTSMREQENNRRNNRLITYKDRTQTLSQWASETGIHRKTIQYRLNHGWSVEDALNRVVLKERRS